MSGLRLQYFSGAQGAPLPFYGDHKDIYIGDTVSSTKDDPEHAITSGFFKVEEGGKATATYTYFEVKYIVEGVLIISDGEGQKVRAVKGDVLYFPKGATSLYTLSNAPRAQAYLSNLVTFETETGGTAFFVGQRIQK